MAGPQSVAQFRNSLETGAIAPVYLFEGEEPQLHEECLRLLDRAAVPEGDRNLDREILQGDEVTLQEIIELASTFPMGGGHRLIVVRAAGRLRADSIDGLKDYLGRPAPRSCLVFSDLRFDRRKSIYRELQKKAVRIDCAPLGEAQMVRWVREYLGAAGFSIDAELAEAITSGLSGDGLGRLRAELDKLMSAAGTPRAIGPADLELLASVPRVGDAFLLARQILNGDRGAAVNSLRVLLAAGEEPVMLLGGISWYFRNALKARAARDRRVPPREIGVRYGIDPGRVERFGREVGRIGERDLEAALRLCAAADSELKGRGARDPAHAFERLIHRIGLGSRGAH